MAGIFSGQNWRETARSREFGISAKAHSRKSPMVGQVFVASGERSDFTLYTAVPHHKHRACVLPK
jgi:hypothetical protein